MKLSLSLGWLVASAAVGRHGGVPLAASHASLIS